MIDVIDTDPIEIGKVKIPDAFYRRIKTGVKEFDELIGGDLSPGFLPGSVGTISGRNGTGKSRLFLQIHQMLSDQGIENVYNSGEMSVEQLAYISREQMNINNVKCCSKTNVEQIEELIEHYDFVTIDSWPTIVHKDEETGFKAEKDTIKRIYSAAHSHETVVMIVMHLTKTGDMKGGTHIPHTVDFNLKMDLVDPEVDPQMKQLFVDNKNRFGPVGAIQMRMNGFGVFEFDVEPVEIVPKSDTGKRHKTKKEHSMILQNFENGMITIEKVSKLLDGNRNRAYIRLRELVDIGRIEKGNKKSTWVIKQNS